MTRRKTDARNEAKKRGDKFFDWKPGCLAGHTVFYTSNQRCVMCVGMGAGERTTHLRRTFLAWASSETKHNLSMEDGEFVNQITRDVFRAWCAAKTRMATTVS